MKSISGWSDAVASPRRPAVIMPRCLVEVRSMVLVLVAGVGLLGASGALLPSVTHAQSCDSNTNVFTRCAEELRSGVRNTFKYRNYNNYDAARRAGSVGEAVKRCVDCAWDSFKDSASKVQIRSNSRYSGSGVR